MSDTPEKGKLESLIKNLSDFLDIPSARTLTKELKSKIAKIETKAAKAAESIEAKSARVVKANISRSSKMRKEHHFVNLIHGLTLKNDIRKADGTPVTYLDVRKQLKARREGRDVNIPDVIWRNASP